MVEQKFAQQFDGLLEKYTELLLGDSNEELKEKVQMWALYTYISKSMPPLVKHWNELYPDGKENIKSLIEEIRDLNQKNRSQ